MFQEFLTFIKVYFKCILKNHNTSKEKNCEWFKLRNIPQLLPYKIQYHVASLCIC